MSNTLFKSLSEAQQYVNTINHKLSCKVATTGNITLSGEQTIDGVSIVAGDRVLVKHQGGGGSHSDNGIYVCSTGQWFRSTDMNNNETCRPSSFVTVEQSTSADKMFQLTNDSIVMGTTELNFKEYGGGIEGVTAGAGLTGGGSSGTVTLNVAGGTGITANADDIAIDSTVTTLTGSQILTNKTLTSATLNSAVLNSAVLNTGVSGTAIKDEDGLASNSATHLATQRSIKAYVDSVASGLDVRGSCRVATTGNITLSNIQTIDGILLTAGDRVLVKDHSTSSKNGIYLCVDGDSWTRATDFDSNTEVTSGAFTFIEEGTLNADAGFVLTTDGNITVDSTSLSFTQFSGAGQITDGNGLKKSGNILSIDAKSDSGIILDSTELSLNLGATSIAGTLSVTSGGTGQTSFTDGELLIGNTTGNILSKATLTAGSNINIINGNGSIKISSTDTNTTYSIKDGELSQNNFTTNLKNKLDVIEASATADQTDAEIRAAVKAASDSNVFTDADHTKLDGIEASADVTDATNVAAAGAVMNSGGETIAGTKTFSSTIAGSINGNAATVTNGIYTTSSVTQLNDVSSAGSGKIITSGERTKLNGIEASATTDQTAAEIRTLVESASNSNVFTDADHTKLNGIASGAQVNVATNLSKTVSGTGFTIISSTGDNIALTLSDTDNWGLMSDEMFDKLDGIEASATADQTDAEIRAAVEAATDSNVFTDADHTKLNDISASADVTDATTVAAAGALMDSEMTDIAGVKGVTISTLQVKPSEGAFANGDKTKLDGAVINTGNETIAGEKTFSTGVFLSDNVKAAFGDGPDLEIYHDGSNSYIDDIGTGTIKYRSGTQTFTNADSSKTMAIFNSASSVDLFYNNSKKLETTNTGVSIGGDLTVSGDITALTSDKRLKKNIEIIEDPLEKINKLSGFTYDWALDKCEEAGLIPKDERQIGVFAQDVQSVIPEAVKPAPFDNIDGKSISGDNYLTVQYEKIVPLLIESVKEQQKMIQNLQGQIDELKNKII